MSTCHRSHFQIKTDATPYGFLLFVYISFLMIAICDSSTFDASASSQWFDQTIDCQNGQPCNITCDMTSSCKQATINCPTDAACRVECTANSACDSATITWPTQPGLGFLDCSGDYACRGIEFPIPDPTTPLSPRCMKSYECANATLNCPTDADCAIHCHYQYACYGTTVNWPSDDQEHSHTINCVYPPRTCLGISFEPVLDDYYEAFVSDFYANEEIICNDDKPCTVLCYKDRSCLNATIQCPANNACDVECDAAEACSRTQINCPPNSACSVTCTDSSACYKADITWPVDSQLGTLTCHGTMDMISSGPDGGDPICKQSVFSSSRDNQFEDQDMVCVDNADCAIYCNHDYACSANIICPPHHECNITCSHASSCRGADITCPIDAPCNVVCAATSSCYQANIAWPTLPGLGTIECQNDHACHEIGEFPIPNPTETLYVHCNNKYECANNSIICPPYGDCTVYCFYQWSCMGMTVDWGINYRENGYAQTMSCSYDESFIGMSFLPVFDDYYEAFVKYQYQDDAIICNDDKPCTVLCHEKSSCKNTTIQCPPHSDCNIECTAVSACQLAEITCPVDANCTIECTASNACDWASIRWSTTPGLGSIDCVGDAACRGIEFPIPNPTVPVYETCSKGYECANATFICPTDATCHVQCHYDWSCFGLTIWRPATGYTNGCVHGNACTGLKALDVALIPTRKPTTSPTKHPTQMPSIPTQNPTKYPTNMPSRTPSKYPTDMPSQSPTTAEPSSNPSKYPTDMPSVTPSKDPSKSPSDVPSKSPTDVPSKDPSTTPTDVPSQNPSKSPSGVPSKSPTDVPSDNPSKYPTDAPSQDPTDAPSQSPSQPSTNPSKDPTVNPTKPLVVRVPTGSPSKFGEAPVGSDSREFSTTYEGGSAGNANASGGNETNTLNVVIGVAGALGVIVAILVVIICKQRKRDENDFEQAEKRLQSTDVQLPPVVRVASNEIVPTGSIAEQPGEGNAVDLKLPQVPVVVPVLSTPPGHGQEEDGEGDEETDEELYEEFDDDDADQQATTGGGGTTSDDYGLIRKILIGSNVDDWETCLDHFLENQMTDAVLMQVPKDDDIWKELVPKAGPRWVFQKKWFQELEAIQ